MSLVVNNNMMAANTARNLNAHYGRLATSTQRLSSGLRVNSAADDAAGLAIRELQRADIAALHQGARNANDAISMIQVADGSLGIIDEKLIRMKELAEQAATGTYDSTQRLMIESEYQAMASEITRIANATDFNGTKLLDGTLNGDHDGSKLVSEGKMKIHFGTGNDSAEDYYYVEIGECTSQAFGLGNASTWQDVQRRGVDAFKDSLTQQIKSDDSISEEERGQLLAAVDGAGEELEAALTKATDYRVAFQLWAADSENEGFLKAGKNWAGNSTLMEDYLAAAAKAQEDAPFALDGNGDVADTGDEIIAAILAQADKNYTKWDALPAEVQNEITAAGTDTTAIQKILDPYFKEAKESAMQAGKDAGLNKDDLTKLQLKLEATSVKSPTSSTDWDTMFDPANGVLGKQVKAAFGTSTSANATTINKEYVAQRNQGKAEAKAAMEEHLDTFWNGLRDTEKQKLQYAWGQAAIYNLANADYEREPKGFGIYADKLTFGDKLADPESIDAAKEMLSQALDDMQAKVGHMDFAGHTVETQEDAQMALDAINEAIVSKDKIRAHLGAAQNRLENTVSNLNIQAENLQAAESRISDVDVATEMTQFVRNQILTQSAVAMLSQANSLPQMAMQLIGG